MIKLIKEKECQYNFVTPKGRKIFKSGIVKYTDFNKYGVAIVWRSNGDANFLTISGKLVHKKWLCEINRFDTDYYYEVAQRAGKGIVYNLCRKDGSLLTELWYNKRVHLKMKDDYAHIKYNIYTANEIDNIIYSDGTLLYDDIHYNTLRISDEKIPYIGVEETNNKKNYILNCTTNKIIAYTENICYAESLKFMNCDKSDLYYIMQSNMTPQKIIKTMNIMYNDKFIFDDFKSEIFIPFHTKDDSKILIVCKNINDKIEYHLFDTKKEKDELLNIYDTELTTELKYNYFSKLENITNKNRLIYYKDKKYYIYDIDKRKTLNEEGFCSISLQKNEKYMIAEDDNYSYIIDYDANVIRNESDYSFKYINKNNLALARSYKKNMIYNIDTGQTYECSSKKYVDCFVDKIMISDDSFYSFQGESNNKKIDVIDFDGNIVLNNIGAISRIYQSDYSGIGYIIQFNKIITSTGKVIKTDKKYIKSLTEYGKYIIMEFEDNNSFKSYNIYDQEKMNFVFDMTFSTEPKKCNGTYFIIYNLENKYKGKLKFYRFDKNNIWEVLKGLNAFKCISYTYQSISNKYKNAEISNNSNVYGFTEYNVVISDNDYIL